MPYALGALDLNNVADATYGQSDGQGGVDWTAVITTAEGVVGQLINGQPAPTRYPTYLPASSAPASSAFASLQSNPLLLLALAGVGVYLVKRGR